MYRLSYIPYRGMWYNITDQVCRHKRLSVKLKERIDSSGLCLTLLATGENKILSINCQSQSKEEEPQMEKETLSVPNISCGHCVNSIKSELSEIEGVKSVEGSPENKSITVEWDAPASLEKIKATMKEINYPAA